MIMNLEVLANAINKTNTFFLNKVEKQVNAALTLRNWVIGYYIVEYEQHGLERAEYGNKLMAKLSNRLRENGLKGMSETNLRLFRQFYDLYPQIQQAVAVEFQNTEFQHLTIRQALPDQLIEMESSSADELLNKLSFTHFIELFRIKSPAKRFFYEREAINNNWSVRRLEQERNSLLYERYMLSTDKEPIKKEVKELKHPPLTPETVIRNPYVLEFLGLDEKPHFTEKELETAIISHLQKFLQELGKGFCFEARQKRITFDNTHYRIDLVFYHRILKCHVLIDLKIGDFSHADVGQMNLYLNYYKDQESYPGDNPPIGIILCAGKREALVKYATSGMENKLFVSEYMTNLPSEASLARIIAEEQEKIQ